MIKRSLSRIISGGDGFQVGRPQWGEKKKVIPVALTMPKALGDP